VSTSATPDVPYPDGPRADGFPGSVSAAAAYWQGWREVRADLATSLRLVAALALAGIPAGLLWWWLAPRADFRITADGPAVIGNPSNELLVADDSVFALVLAGVGLLAGIAAWFLRRRRGVATVVALALGTAATGAVAWWVGQLLGPGPTAAQLHDVGGRVTTSLSLGSLPALAVAPFMAVFAYLVAVLYTHRDDLGREARGDAASVPSDDPAPAADALLVDSPPPGRPAA
jgi:LPXTG-motif cell wall-anchored protein